jgi:N-acetylneuraminic acid mutarotase
MYCVFAPAGRLTQGRSYHTATLLPDGRVLVVGGEDSDGALASAEVWNPGTSPSPE